MVCQQIQKTAGLLIALVLLVGSLLYIPDWYAVGVFKDCPLWSRLGYSLFHASFLHALLNVWCFLSILFLYNIKVWHILAAYAIAVAVPSFVLSSTPTVGFSAVDYALLGIVATMVGRKVYYNLCIGIYILVGFLFPFVAGWLHLYSYVAGLVVGLLTMPIPCRR